MAQETNQTQVPMLCSTGCGFYGNPRNSGMCSVCYKEHLQRRGGRSSPPGDKAASPSGSLGAPAVTVETDPGLVSDPVTASDETSSSTTPVTQQISTMSISQDTAAISSDRDDTEDEEEDDTSSKSKGAAADESQMPSDGEQTPDKSKKKNRCFTCRKKVGLTGFDCRCGNLFCAIHRYSDKHDCPFDYRGAAAAQLRKENPIVMAEKIQKL